MNNLQIILDRMMRTAGIEYYGAVGMDRCRIVNQRLMNKLDFTPENVILMLIPYYPGDSDDRIVSLYAVPRDYHTFVADLCRNMIKNLEVFFSQAHFACFSDVSPISETYAAAMAGLGRVGDNGMLINEKYGTYVFIGGIFTDYFPECTPREVEGCEHCGACKAACPTGALDGRGECLSKITQTKGELSPENIALMRKYNTAWGCDLCQTSCPHNRTPKLSPFDYFRTELVYSPDVGCKIDDRAYNWKGQACIDRNIKIIKGEKQ